MRRLPQLGPTTDVVGSGNNGRQGMTRRCSTVRTWIVRYLHSTRSANQHHTTQAGEQWLRQHLCVVTSHDSLVAFCFLSLKKPIKSSTCSLTHRHTDNNHSLLFTTAPTELRVNARLVTHAHTHTRLTALCPRLSRYQKGKTNLDFTEARDSEW